MDYRTRIVVSAPPGPLGVVLNKMCAYSEGCCSVSSVDKSSALHKKVLPGDWLFAIDSAPVRFWTLNEVQSMLFEKKENPVRMLSFLRSPVGLGHKWPNEALIYTTPGRSVPVSFIPMKDSLEEAVEKPFAAAQKALSKIPKVEEVEVQYGTEVETKTVSCQTEPRPPPSEEEEEDESIRYMPPKLRKFLDGEEPQLRHRLEVKEAFVRACELYENVKALEPVYKDQRLSSVDGVTNCGTNKEMANSLLKDHITKWRREYQAIMSFPDNKLSVQELRFKELVTFRMEYGHSNVPNKHENATLRNWCGRVRNRKRNGPRVNSPSAGKRKRRQDAKAALNKWDAHFEEDVKLLDRLGFQWNPAERLTEQWEEHVAALTKYKEKHGTACIPTQKSGPLGRWVVNLRKEYNHHVLKGLPSRLTPERIKQLEAIGFVWSVREMEMSGKYVGEARRKRERALAMQRGRELEEQQEDEEYEEFDEYDEYNEGY